MAIARKVCGWCADSVRHWLHCMDTVLDSSVNNGLVYRPASNSVNCCHALLLNTLASSHLCHPRETNELALTIHWKSRFPTGFSISVSPNGRLARHSHQRHLRQPYPIKYNDRPIRFDSVEEADPMAEGQQASYLLGFFLVRIPLSKCLEGVDQRRSCGPVRCC
ncbi:hypothetical protein BO99DRAFT_57293 [Aspergillus violaceofuscus CBS 115571]|uniref:Uncharacterized protein n=1 Tax=Aspergillus violaceofuscus (strain CBS 115571) TaxID=1450538 RepID=A0A2V5HBW0_ASPV1|nr:hypothetical protein BO99DRAFT_57293 [Aspergillus violaceofuscus CBS 115571]